MNAADAGHYRVTLMSAQEVGTAIRWAEAEGWNPGLHDATAFYAADPGGFLAGQFHGETVATLSAVKYAEDFGFIGLYIVQPAYRGRGFGYALWEHALASLAGRNVGLDGVLAQQDNYRRSGFRFAHRNIRYAGRTRNHHAPSPRAVPARQVGFSDLAASDRAMFPAERDHFLRHWIGQDASHTWVIADGSRLLGYGTVRACRQGFKIGPLNADDEGVAAELLGTLSCALPDGSDLFLDVPEPNTAAIALAQARGMTPAFETARMYTGAFPALPLARIFGITTFELG
jgi:ribosomal protein S18 acetylase RimI-like enzyme